MHPELRNDDFDLHPMLRSLIRTPELDLRARREPELVARLFERCRAQAELAWGEGAVGTEADAARLDTQRALYELNRLLFFWYDAPAHYANERSRLLAEVHELLEAPFQGWLARAVPGEGLDRDDPARTLRAWVERDLTAPEEESWFGEHAQLPAYRRLLTIVSLNGLVEASQLSRVMGGPQHPVQNTLFRILMEEYGAGRPHKKHAHFFARMLAEQGLDERPEAYFLQTPWEVIAAINHSFALTERRSLFLRFCGAFTYTEVSTPVGFRGYAAAARRLGLSDGHDDYWALHVREDERHGAWMVQEVAAPLFTQFPDEGRDVLLGYAQQRVVEGLAGAATERACRKAQEGARS